MHMHAHAHIAHIAHMHTRTHTHTHMQMWGHAASQAASLPGNDPTQYDSIAREALQLSAKQRIAELDRSLKEQQSDIQVTGHTCAQSGHACGLRCDFFDRVPHTALHQAGAALP